ncbi:MAG: hypothetical protein EHM89_08745, partial [Acidobacteria bacterium]
MTTEFIDTLLKRLTAHGGRGLRLESGAPVRMTDAAGVARDVTARALTRQEILGAVGPIVPDEARRRLPEEGSVEF